MQSIKLLFQTVIILWLGYSPCNAQEQGIVLTLNFAGCDPVPQVFAFNGFSFDSLSSAVSTGDENTYSLTLPSTSPRFYYIGEKDKPLLPIILGSESGLELTGSCSNARRTEIKGSELNLEYATIKERMKDFRTQFSRQLMAYRQAKNKEDMEKAVADMRTLDLEKSTFLDSVRQGNPFLGNVVALNTYLSFFNNNNGRYKNEMEYFANEYFKFADFSDPAYESMPWVFESFQSYAQTLSSVGLPPEKHQAFLETTLSKTPAGSPTRQLAYGGIIYALEEKKHDNLVYFAENFLNEFPDASEATSARLEDLIVRTRAFSVGGVAPDFSQQTPEGEEINLSDLRGKVVLVDFWASWCGPCRQENPNVVRMYNEYKEHGFEILGVSLDNKRDNWIKAIEKDGLTWFHVSDLKGWKNEVAQAYSVQAIPQTILLDREGRIIARNLRGAALEEKLREIFQ